MQNDAHGSAAVSTSTTTPISVTGTQVTTSSTGRPTLPHISVYTGVPDRQTVQVAHQALHRHPSTAAQYLQQMYAAQQQHLMLQTAALQQRQLSNARLQSLVAVQQATMGVGGLSSSQSRNHSQQTGSTQTTGNLAMPPTAGPLISRAQIVSSAPTGMPQQAMLLGNSSSPILAANQAQMYLRAQMFIFTPTSAVPVVQSEALTQSVTNQQSASPQNLASSSLQGTPSSQPQGICLQPMSPEDQLSSAGQLRSPNQAPPGAMLGLLEGHLEGGPKGNGPLDQRGHMVSVSSSVTAFSGNHLISPAYAQIQTHQLLQQHKQQQFVFQQQAQSRQLPLRIHTPVLHTASIHSCSQGQTPQSLAIQPQHMQESVSVLPKPLVSGPGPNQQATVFHSTLSPAQICTHNEPPVVPQSRAAHLPVAELALLVPGTLQAQTTALTVASQLLQDGAGEELPTSEVVTKNSPTHLVRQQTALSTVGAPEQCPSDPSNTTTPTGGREDAERLNAQPGAGSFPAMTSGNGNNAPTVTGSTPQNGENKPPQALVKPQILTHVIEGFVIQEGAEPFPVERPLSLLIENLRKHKQQTHFDSEKTTTSSNSTTDSDMEDLSQQELKQKQEKPTLTCELCGRVDFASNFKRSKRFCSTVCAKRYNVGCTKRMGLFPNRQTTVEKLKKQRTSIGNHQNLRSETKKQTVTTGQQPGGGLRVTRHPSHPGHGESSQCSDMSSYEGPPSPPLSAASSGAPRSQVGRGPEHTEACGPQNPLSQHFLPSDPAKWNVEDVYAFICSLPGCLEIAEEFRSQEIDGQSLLLLKEDHLMGTMNIKLGPALKIFAQISMLRDS